MLSARERWSPLVQALETSSLTTSAFAERAGVNRQTLSWWRWKIRREARGRPRHPFTEIMVAPAHEPAATVRLHLGHGGAFVDVDEHTDLAWLRDVLEALC